jgi:pimeloyl-ACP methyl ester carboxylesterase
VRWTQAAALARREGLGRVHPLDLGYAALAGWKFGGGWGDEAVLRRFDADDPFEPGPEPILPRFGEPQPAGAGRCFRDGTFRSPLAGEVPEPVATGRVRHLFRPGARRRATVVLLSGSGEEGYALRSAIHGPLVDAGVELWMLESPFYGARRAPGQRSAELPLVSEQALVNLGMVAEGRGLLLGLRQVQAEPVVVAGYSMGAYMASLVAVRTPFAVGVVALAGGDSARDIYTRSLLSLSIDFHRLGQGDAEAARARLGDFYHRTRLSLRAPPLRPDAAVVLGARRDGYIPPRETEALHRHWRGSTLLEVDAGHISAVLTGRRALREAVALSVARLESPPPRAVAAAPALGA